MIAAAAPKTQVEALVEKLRRDIVSGALKPGDKLRLLEMQQRYQVSSIPIREALSRLTSFGLVTAQGQRGFSVAKVSSDDMLDLIKTMCWMEAIHLRSAIAFGDRDWEANILAAGHRFGIDETDTDEAKFFDDEWERRHREFHGALVKASRATRLLAQREILFENVDRYRRIGVLYQVGRRDVTKEHRTLMGAVLDRDAARAVACMTEHLIATAKALLLSDSKSSLQIENLIDRLREEITIGLGA